MLERNQRKLYVSKHLICLCRRCALFYPLVFRPASCWPYSIYKISLCPRLLVSLLLFWPRTWNRPVKIFFNLCMHRLSLWTGCDAWQNKPCIICVFIVSKGLFPAHEQIHGWTKNIRFDLKHNIIFIICKNFLPAERLQSKFSLRNA